MNKIANKNLRSLAKLFALTVVMFGFGYALVPFYDVFCDLTGFGGKTQIATAEEAAGAEQQQREITVQFVGNVQGDMPWDFKPAAWQMKVKVGALNDASFWVKNRSARDMVGQAVPSVTPSLAGLYFKKTECFCFTQQPLAAGEEQEMWLKFFVDSELPAEINTITLSYAFFDAGKYKKAALAGTTDNESS